MTNFLFDPYLAWCNAYLDCHEMFVVLLYYTYSSSLQFCLCIQHTTVLINAFLLLSIPLFLYWIQSGCRVLLWSPFVPWLHRKVCVWMCVWTQIGQLLHCCQVTHTSVCLQHLLQEVTEINEPEITLVSRWERERVSRCEMEEGKTERQMERWRRALIID